MDLIERRAAIDAILADKIDAISLKVMTALGDGRLALTLNDACDRHIRDIEKLPSAQPEQRWIPCSERMPEESGWYIVTVEDETDTHLRWFSMLHGFEWDEKDNTIAWMPLPEPYKDAQ